MYASLKAGGSNAILSCDLAGHLVACGGSDRSCRIYNVKTKRLVHQLVGHSHKITSVRFFDGTRGIITASADRRLKVWDISKTTYRQLTSIHLNSTANSIDVAFDSSTIVTGHVDGGVCLFDIRTGQKTLEIEGSLATDVTAFGQERVFKHMVFNRRFFSRTFTYVPIFLGLSLFHALTN